MQQREKHTPERITEPVSAAHQYLEHIPVNIENVSTNSQVNGSMLFVKAISRCQHTDWDLCELIRIQELNETRQRASQMENTMRWWSQCTASWRQKWDTVRNERNRAREELTRTRNALHEMRKENERLSDAKERSDADAKSLMLKLQKAQLQNRLQPILQDVSVVERIANVLTSKIQKQNISSESAEMEIKPNHLGITIGFQSLEYEEFFRRRIDELQMEQISMLENIATLNDENVKLKEQLEGKKSPTLPSVSCISSSTNDSNTSFTSAKSVCARSAKFGGNSSGFITSGETPVHTPMYQYGKGKTQSRRSDNNPSNEESGVRRRRNSFC